MVMSPSPPAHMRLNLRPAFKRPRSVCCVSLSCVASRLARRLRFDPACSVSPCCTSVSCVASRPAALRLDLLAGCALLRLRAACCNCVCSASLRCTSVSCAVVCPAAPRLNRPLSTRHHNRARAKVWKTGGWGDGVSSFVLTCLSCRQPHLGAPPVWLSGSLMARLYASPWLAVLRLCSFTEHLRLPTFSSGSSATHFRLTHGASAVRLTRGSRRFGPLPDSFSGWCRRCWRVLC